MSEPEEFAWGLDGPDLCHACGCMEFEIEVHEWEDVYGKEREEWRVCTKCGEWWD